MATYNAAAVADAAIGFEKPITLQQGRALRDNPLATFEGATDAPYNQASWHPYDGVLVGDSGDGVIYSFGVDGSVANVVSPDFVDGYEYRFIFTGLDSASAVTAFSIELYRETSATYGAYDVFTYATVTATGARGIIEVVRPREAALAHAVLTFGTKSTATAADNSELSGYVTSSPSQKMLRARFSFTTANIVGGNIIMQRRRCF